MFLYQTLTGDIFADYPAKRLFDRITTVAKEKGRLETCPYVAWLYPAMLFML